MKRLPWIRRKYASGKGRSLYQERLEKALRIARKAMQEAKDEDQFEDSKAGKILEEALSRIQKLGGKEGQS